MIPGASPPKIGGADPPSFLADQMLGKLAKWLRVFGFDTIYLRSPAPKKIHETLRPGRILLTRNSRLGPRLPSAPVLLLEANHPSEQLREVLARLNLKPDPGRWFSRCLRCNRVLERVPREEVAGMVPTYVYLHQSQFSRCPECGRLYWPGTHAEAMRRRLLTLLQGFPAAGQPHGRH